MISKVAGRSLMCVAVFACDKQRAGAPQRFLRQGVTYSIVLVPERGSVGLHSDSAQGSITVDAVRGDSAFGRFDLPLGSVGLPEAIQSAGPARFDARETNDSVTILLNAHVTDAGVWLSGVGSKDSTTGTWVVAQRRLKGVFRLSRTNNAQPASP